MTKMKNQIKISLIIISVLITGIISSCKKDYLDINDNPNYPADVAIEQLMPSAELAIAHAVGNNLQIYGGLWGQFWTQSPSSSQYKTFEQYSPAANDFDATWGILYADALQDLKTIESKAIAENKPNYVACSKIMQAYCFQVLTDNFGDVPFSEALQGETAILAPKYDSQESIYNGIIELLNSGLSTIDDTSEAPFFPGTDDVIFGGDMSLWRKFGNTLKLRVFLRLAYVSPAKAQAGVEALEADGAEFLGGGENAQIAYTSEGGNTNPLYSSFIEIGQTQNLVASATAVNYLSNNNDPRLDVFYDPASNGSQVGIPQGAYTLSAGTPVSVPGAAIGGHGEEPASAEAPVRLLTGYESLFLQSEAAARGWISSGTQTLYEEAITANFTDFGLSGGDAATYYAQTDISFPSGGTFEDQLKAIATQKWIALCGNANTEAWTEWRRTGYPDFFTISANTILGPNVFPQRFYYPSAEVTRNVNFPGQQEINVKVWWDVKP